MLSKDSVTVAVDAVVYYRVSNATISITNVEDAARSTRLLAATTLRNVLGTKNLSEILADRENISHFMQVCSSLDHKYCPKGSRFWGLQDSWIEYTNTILSLMCEITSQWSTGLEQVLSFPTVVSD